MNIDPSLLLIILGCALVTLIPRIIPFAVIRNANLPQPVVKFLSYIPVCLLTALIVQGTIQKTGTALTFNWINVLIIVPTLITAIKTKSLLATVIVGIVAAAIIRWLLVG